MCDNRIWEELDDDLEKILEVALQGSVERKINSLVTIVYNVSKERFGKKRRAMRLHRLLQLRTDMKEKSGITKKTSSA